MAKKEDYEALENIAVTALAGFLPEIKEVDPHYMSYGKEFAINTPKAGIVTFWIDRDSLENKKGEPATISIFGRFDNPKAARALGFDSNQFSGKWNHHFLGSAGHILAAFTELKNRAY